MEWAFIIYSGYCGSKQELNLLQISRLWRGQDGVQLDKVQHRMYVSFKTIGVLCKFPTSQKYRNTKA
jgi:hypothetical protein